MFNEHNADNIKKIIDYPQSKYTIVTQFKQTKKLYYHLNQK